MSDSSKGLIGFVAGAVAGGLAGILLAPDKGVRTRVRLKRSADDICQRGTEFVSEAEQQLKEGATAQIESIKGHAEELKTEAKHHLDAVKEATHEAKEAYQRELKNSEPEDKPKKA